MAVTDFLKQPLAVGQTVIIRRPRYADLTVGVVCKLTVLKAHVAYMPYFGTKCDKHLIDQDSIVATDSAVAQAKAEPIIQSAIAQGWLEVLPG